MVWWAWVLIGLTIIAIEFTLVDAAFYLFFIGLAAMLTGAILWIGFEASIAVHYVLFVVIAITITVLFRRKIYDKLRGDPIGFADQVDGRHVDVLEDVGKGAQTRVAFRGSRWTAVNVGEAALKAGEQALIVKAEGSMLNIKAIGSATAEQPHS